MRVTPKISDSPAATRKSADASASPLTSCTSRFESIVALSGLRSGASKKLRPLTRYQRINSAQTVFALDLACLQSADTRQRPARRRDRNGHDDLVCTRRVGDAGFDRIEMAAHVGSVLVAKRHVDCGAERADLFR